MPGEAMLDEAKRLFALGAAVHWIKPNSKAPVKAGWSGPTRDEWETLTADYRKGYGLGVRLGESSDLGSGFLANVDIDIKSSDPRHRKEALQFVEKKFPGLLHSAPTVKTGYGLRLFVKTAEPLRSGKLGASNEECKAYMPTAEVNRRQKAAVAEGRFTAAELEAGWRLRSAWEVEFMSTGKQVVLPPSIHPETKKPYLWERPFTSAADIPMVRLDDMEIRINGRPKGVYGTTFVRNFKPVTVDLVGSTLPNRIVDMILTGLGVTDRSAALYGATCAMLRHKFSDIEILSVLTDRDTFLGEVAYEHRGTDSRASAAGWVRDYTLAKAKEELDAAAAFTSEVSVTPTLERPEDVTAQETELTGSTAWESKLVRGGANGEGPPKPTLANLLLVLRNAVGSDLFKRDEFAFREFYGRDAPWVGGKKGKALTDDDTVNLKEWVAKNYRFEISQNIINEAMTIIATANAYHPIREMLEALPPWDGIPRIDTWLKSHFEARGPDEYLAQVFRKWLVASVTRTYIPGYKFDWMLLLEGKQGSGKSSFGSNLFGEEYCLDGLPKLNDKDAALGLQGIRCVEFGELDQMRRNEVETVKAFVTRCSDKVRPPFGKRWVESRRQCVFFGTTNKDEYLKDDTGNRRFIPVEVGQLDWDQLARDKNQLWAEALFIYKNGLEPSLYLEDEARTHAEKKQLDKMVTDESDVMLDELRDYFARPPENIPFSLKRFRMKDLFEATGPFAKHQLNNRNLQFAARALKQCNYRRFKSNGISFWVRER